MLVRKLDAAGYARVKHWRVYAEEGLAHHRGVVRLGEGEMAVEYAGQALARYDVSLSRGPSRRKSRRKVPRQIRPWREKPRS